MMKLSCCVIVKNEESVLEETLQSVVDRVDELVIVDTGSTDKTKEIANRFTNKVFDYPWSGNFAEARNFSVSKASFDWVFILDADERVIHFDRSMLEIRMEEQRNQPIQVEIRSRQRDGNVSRDKISRIFDRRRFAYAGAIHESIAPITPRENEDMALIDGEEKRMTYLDCPIVIDHIGYLEEQLVSNQKLQRNEVMLREALLKAPRDSYLMYQLGKTLDLTGKRSDALSFFLQVIGNGEHCSDYWDDLIISAIYGLTSLNRLQEARDLADKYRIDEKLTELADFNFCLAYLDMCTGRFSEAVAGFVECTRKTKEKVIGSRSWLAYYNLGVIWECLGDFVQALEWYQKASNYGPALERARVILNKESDKK